MTHEEFHTNEMKICMQAGGIAGGVAAAITNPLEAITVAVQVNPLNGIGQIIKTEGLSLITKGLTPRVTYNVCQSVIFFSLIKHIEKSFDVKLEDD